MSCKCGCNGDTNPGKDYINGHQRRGKKFSAETINKMRAAHRHSVQRPRTCAVCDNDFLPDHSRRTTCGPECKKTLKQSVRTAWFATEAGRLSNEMSAAARRAMYAANPHKHREYHLRALYKISIPEFEAMRTAQDGCCAICREVFSRTPHIDHDHKTGAVRGLLCGACNVGVGGLKDNPERMEAAAAYIRERQAPNLRLIEEA